MSNYWRKTLKNKLMAILLVICGGLTIPLENDCTAAVFMLFIAIPLFITDENVIR